MNSQELNNNGPVKMGPVDIAVAQLTPADAVDDPEVREKILQIRSMWQFSAMFQWIFMFKGVVGMENEDVDIEVIEKELLGLLPVSLVDKIRLSLLQGVVNQRNLVLDQFDEFARKQYRLKLPESECPLGDEDNMVPYEDLDVIDKIKILYRLCELQMANAERFRERMGNLKEAEEMTWRVDPVGWDSEGKVYYLLDDNRLYSRYDPPEELKKSSKKKKRRSSAWSSGPTRRSKRRRTTDGSLFDDQEEQDDLSLQQDSQESILTRQAYSSMDQDSVWTCVCANYAEWTTFVKELTAITKDKTKLSERDFLQFVKKEIMPVIESIEQERVKDEENKLKEIEKLRIYESRKRSSRIESLADRKKHEEEIIAERERKEQERQRQKAEHKKRLQLERERDVRLHNRDIRLESEARKREAAEAKKAASKAAKLAALQSKTIDESTPARRSTRHVERQQREEKERLERQKQALQTQQSQQIISIAAQKDAKSAPQNWYFDCVCGIYGDNYDDGELSVCCGKCDIWMHVSCLAPDELRRFERSVESQQLREEMEEKKERRERKRLAHNKREKIEDEDEDEENEIVEIEEVEFICSRCVRLEKERKREIELERKRENDRRRRLERERRKEEERRRHLEEEKLQMLHQQQQQHSGPGSITVSAAAESSRAGRPDDVYPTTTVTTSSQVLQSPLEKQPSGQSALTLQNLSGTYNTSSPQLTSSKSSLPMASNMSQMNTISSITPSKQRPQDKGSLIPSGSASSSTAQLSGPLRQTSTDPIAPLGQGHYQMSPQQSPQHIPSIHSQVLNGRYGVFHQPDGHTPGINISSAITSRQFHSPPSDSPSNYSHSSEIPQLSRAAPHPIQNQVMQPSPQEIGSTQHSQSRSPVQMQTEARGSDEKSEKENGLNILADAMSSIVN
ncbi:hypothetical protein V1511DRAFT_468457 [Dipodascopsis uninucleata]